MSARPIASGTISFGLVSIPIKLYAAADASAGVSFNMLHAKDSARLKQQYICTKDGEIVPRDQMVKGYEFSKDRYVTFTPEELKALEEQSTQSIEVVEFVPIAKVDPVYFDRTLLRRSRQGRRQGLRAPLRGHEGHRARRARPVRRARQDVPRDAPARSRTAS